MCSYTTKTGRRFVDFKGIEADIVNFGLYQQDATEFIAVCTVDGNITCWKASNGLKVKHIHLDINQVRFFQPFEHSGKYRAFLVWVNNNGQLSTGLFHFDTYKLHPMSLVYKNSKNCKLAIGANFIALISGRKLFIDNIENEKSQQVKIKIAKRKFTAIAAHPSESAVLTGDDTGRIVLWQNLFGYYTQAVFHWHTLPVNTICFSSSGTTFFSGADECVLVKWTVDDSTRKGFLPRMSNCIQQVGIAPENLYLAVASKDNAIHIVDMQFNPVSIIQELILGDEFPAGIHWDSKTRALVLNGTVGHLQFYSPHNKQLLYNVSYCFFIYFICYFVFVVLLSWM